MILFKWRIILWWCRNTCEALRFLFHRTLLRDDMRILLVLGFLLRRRSCNISNLICMTILKVLRLRFECHLREQNNELAMERLICNLHLRDRIHVNLFWQLNDQELYKFSLYSSINEDICHFTFSLHSFYWINSSLNLRNFLF